MTQEELIREVGKVIPNGVYSEEVIQLAFTMFTHGYNYAVEKACEFIRLHIGVDIPVRLTPDGQPLAEDFFNKAEARANAAQNVVEQFKQFMEE